MATKIRRRLAVMIAGALLAALALVNVAPVLADDGGGSIEMPTAPISADPGSGDMIPPTGG